MQKGKEVSEKKEGEKKKQLVDASTEYGRTDGLFRAADVSSFSSFLLLTDDSERAPCLGCPF